MRVTGIEEHYAPRRSEPPKHWQIFGIRLPVADHLSDQCLLTTGGYTRFPPLQCALSVVGVDRLIFSVDYPYTDNAERLLRL